MEDKELKLMEEILEKMDKMGIEDRKLDKLKKETREAIDEFKKIEKGEDAEIHIVKKGKNVSCSIEGIGVIVISMIGSAIVEILEKTNGNKQLKKIITESLIEMIKKGSGLYE